MNDPNREELISAYLDGELSAEEQAHVERLLAESPELRRWCDELKGMRTRLQALPRRQLGTDFAAAIAARAKQAQEEAASSAALSAAAFSPAPKPVAQPVAKPAAMKPAATKPTATKPKKDEPEISPSRWPFANVSPRMLFWPLAALAAALLLMFAVPQSGEPIAELQDSEKRDDFDRTTVTSNTQETGSGREGSQTLSRDEELYAKNETANGRKFNKTRGLDHSESAEPDMGGTVDPQSVPLRYGFGSNKQSNGIIDRLSSVEGREGLIIVEVVVPETRWDEKSFTRAMAGKNITLKDSSDFFAAMGDHAHDALSPQTHPRQLEDQVERTKLQKDEVNSLKAVAETFRRRRTDTDGDWYLVTAPPENLAMLFDDLRADGNRVQVIDGEANREGTPEFRSNTDGRVAGGEVKGIETKESGQIAPLDGIELKEESKGAEKAPEPTARPAPAVAGNSSPPPPPLPAPADAPPESKPELPKPLKAENTPAGPGAAPEPTVGGQPAPGPAIPSPAATDAPTQPEEKKQPVRNDPRPALDDVTKLETFSEKSVKDLDELEGIRGGWALRLRDFRSSGQLGLRGGSEGDKKLELLREPDAEAKPEAVVGSRLSIVKDSAETKPGETAPKPTAKSEPNSQANSPDGGSSPAGSAFDDRFHHSYDYRKKKDAKPIRVVVVFRREAAAIPARPPVGSPVPANPVNSAGSKEAP